MSERVWQKTACILCECNCGIEVQLGGDDGRSLIRFRGDKAHPSSQGYACEKAHRLNFYQSSKRRLTSPMRRREDGTYEAIDWDTAIREIAGRMLHVKKTWGGKSIFYYGGGSAGSHLSGVYASSFRSALGSHWRSSALAQEKTGLFYVTNRMFGAVPRSDVEHAEVAVFLGKNPWQSHSFPRARVTLKEIAKDPDRKLIVIDPVRTQTAAMADIHLQVRPGGDAWLMAAIVATIVEEELIDREFLSAHAVGLDETVAALRQVPIADFCERAGVPEAQVREAARVIGRASSVASVEDLGVNMNRHSTLVSYLHALCYTLTGNLGRPGSQYIWTPLVDMTKGSHDKRTPVVGARVISGLVPCNVIAEEILTDHPDRYRAMIVDATNPAHSLADSKRFREAMRSLEVSVVLDVAMTETARQADYVLACSSQFEKAEATFFNFDFPHNAFHLRQAMMEPTPGTLPEAEIYARLCEAIGELTKEDLAPLHAAASQGRDVYMATFAGHVMGNPRLSGMAPVIAYRTLGPTLPKGLEGGAVVWGLALRAAMSHSDSLKRAGYEGAPPVQAAKLFDAIIENRSGVVFAVDDWDAVIKRVRTPDGKIHLYLDDLVEALAGLRTEREVRDEQWPFVLSAGERRSFTANTVIRDPEWRKHDRDGALRINPADAASLGVDTGDTLRLTTRRGSANVTVEVTDTMQPGHVSLPNGMGLEPEDKAVALNELTSLEDRDPFVGTPWHKHVRARLERVTAN
jgi:anaerobic selenocysteine-containing dehydrogenase